MASDGVFELRTCQSLPGKLDAFASRIGGVGREILTEHGGEIVGLWTAPDPDDPTTGTVVYICHFPSRLAAADIWDAFHSDERWVAARTATEVDGPLVASAQSLFMSSTEFSPGR